MACFRKNLGIRTFQWPKPFELTRHVEDVLLAGEDDVKNLYVERDDIYYNGIKDDRRSNKPIRPEIANKGGQGERIYSAKGIAITLSAYSGGGICQKRRLFDKRKTAPIASARMRQDYGVSRFIQTLQKRQSGLQATRKLGYRRRLAADCGRNRQSARKQKLTILRRTYLFDTPGINRSADKNRAAGVAGAASERPAHRGGRGVLRLRKSRAGGRFPPNIKIYIRYARDNPRTAYF